jgi:hypothetical protein
MWKLTRGNDHMAIPTHAIFDHFVIGYGMAIPTHAILITLRLATVWPFPPMLSWSLCDWLWYDHSHPCYLDHFAIGYGMVAIPTHAILITLRSWGTLGSVPTMRAHNSGSQKITEPVPIITVLKKKLNYQMNHLQNCEYFTILSWKTHLLQFRFIIHVRFCDFWNFTPPPWEPAVVNN